MYGGVDSPGVAQSESPLLNELAKIEKRISELSEEASRLQVRLQPLILSVPEPIMPSNAKNPPPMPASDVVGRLRESVGRIETTTVMLSRLQSSLQV